MCDPFTISIAATAAGTAASIAGQKKAQRAMGSAQAAENARQSAMRDEANAIFSESLSSNTAKNRVAAETGAAAKRDAAYTADLAGGKRAEVASSYGAEAPRVVADESAARGAAGKMGSAIDARNKAILAGFGDATSDTAVKNARARVNTGVVGDFMKGSASAHGVEMDYASKKGDSLKTVGDILSKIGMVAGMYAAAAPAAASNTITLTGASGAQAATGGLAAGKAAGAAATKTLAAGSAAAKAAAAGLPASASGVTAGALNAAPLSGMPGWDLINQPTWVQRAASAGNTLRSFTGR